MARAAFVFAEIRNSECGIRNEMVERVDVAVGGGGIVEERVGEFGGVGGECGVAGTAGVCGAYGARNAVEVMSARIRVGHGVIWRGSGEEWGGNSTGEFEGLAEGAGDELGAGDAEAEGFPVGLAEKIAFDGDADFLGAQPDTGTATAAGGSVQSAVISVQWLARESQLLAIIFFGGFAKFSGGHFRVFLLEFHGLPL
jgi:hypothetical protein